MTTQRNKLKAGDVLEFPVGNRFAYLHYIGKHPEYGEAVIVCPRLVERQTSMDSGFFADGYVTFYPAALAPAHGLAEVVAHLPPPGVPTRLRRAGRRSGIRVETWIIEDGSREVVKSALSEEELRLPIAGIWNHDYLIQRIAEGWNPMNEGRGG